MVQAAKPRHRNDPATWAHSLSDRTPFRSLLLQTEMRPVVVVVADELGHQPLEMAFVENDDVIEQVSAATTYEALRDSVLPRTAEAGPFRLDAEAFHRVNDFAAEVRRPVEDEVFGLHVIRKRLPQLLGYPGTRRMLGDVAVQDAPPVVADDKEAIQDTEGQSRHGEEVHRSNRFSVVGKERCPSFRRLRTSRSFPHPAQHRPFRYIEAEHLQFAMNPRRSPRPVLGHHTKDQLAQILTHASSARTFPMPREPRPIQLEPCPVPPDNRLRL